MCENARRIFENAGVASRVTCVGVGKVRPSRRVPESNNATSELYNDIATTTSVHALSRSHPRVDCRCDYLH